MYDKRRKTVERATDLRESAEMHREIYRAIRARKPEEARDLMEKHLRMAQKAQGVERPADRKSVVVGSKTQRARSKMALSR